MSKYRRPLLVVAAALAISSLMSACVVVPARGYHRYHRHHGHHGHHGASLTTAPTVPQAATAVTPQA